MDKYQEYILSNLKTIYAYSDSNLIKLNEGMDKKQLTTINIAEKIVINQKEDITITKYHFFLVNEGIDAVYAMRKNEFLSFEKAPLDYHTMTSRSYEKEIQIKQTFYYELDFDNKIDSIKIVFKDNIADDLIVPIEFVDADKEAYYAKKEAERIAELHRRAAIDWACGVNLVNIYFQPCSEQYAKTEITLYRKEFMIAKYAVEGELYFKAITDLADGNYSFVLKQFSADGEVLLETKSIDFRIKN